MRRSSCSQIILGLGALGLATALVAGPLYARNLCRSCVDGRRLIAARINDHFKNLVAAGAFRGLVPRGWQFNQIRARDEQIDLNLTTETGAPRTIALFVNGETQPGELHDSHFRLRVPADIGPADTQVLLGLASVIDDAVSDLDIPCQRTWIDDRRERTSRSLEALREELRRWNRKYWTRQVEWDSQRWSRMESWLSTRSSGLERWSVGKISAVVQWGAAKCAPPLNWILGRSARGPLWLAMALGALKLFILLVAVFFVFLGPRLAKGKQLSEDRRR